MTDPTRPWVTRVRGGYYQMHYGEKCLVIRKLGDCWHVIRVGSNIDQPFIYFSEAKEWSRNWLKRNA